MSAFFSSAHKTAVKALTDKIKVIDEEIMSQRSNIQNARYQPNGLSFTDISGAADLCRKDIEHITHTINTLKTPPWENFVNQIRQLFGMLPLSSTSQHLKARINKRTELASVRSDLKQLESIEKHLSYKQRLTYELTEMKEERAEQKKEKKQARKSKPPTDEKTVKTTPHTTTATAGLFATPKRLWDKITKEKPSPT
nr:hypothetical protein [Gammaproteobacteria bacterium]